jgi:putative thioredoxin
MDEPFPSGNMVEQNPAADGAEIIETTTQSFVADVIEASQEKLVLLDFWAPWCGPCKQLTPLLEKAVSQSAGQVRLVKMNIDEHPQVAQQLQVQSIPAVFAFRGGQPVDGFAGALPESQIKEFIEKNLGGELPPDELEQLLQAGAAALETADHNNAIQFLSAALQIDPKNTAALGGLAQCYLAAGELDAAEQALAVAADDPSPDTAYQVARASLDLARKSASLGDTDAAKDKLTEQLATNPNDHQARFDLALALNAAGDRDGAVAALLEIITRDRQWNEEAARKQLLELFEAYGPTDEVTVDGRRKLSSVLFS